MMNLLGKRSAWLLAAALLFTTGWQIAAAQAPETQNTAPTALQLESLKESVLTLNRDLLILEEELLYPASSQVAVYVSMDIGQYFDLDAIKLEINNQLVASELYTE